MLRLTLLVLIVAACGARSQEVENERVVLQMFEAFNAHDWKAMTALYADDADYLDPSYGPDYVRMTKADIISKYNEMQALFPDLHDEVVGIYPSGNKVVVEFIATGSSGDSLAFRLPIAAVLTLQNGKIIRDATYYNNCEGE